MSTNGVVPLVSHPAKPYGHVNRRQVVRPRATGNPRFLSSTPAKKSPRVEYLDNMYTVLLIDDSKFLRRANELSLKKAGHQVVAASDGEEGLRHAREKKPDVIVLDMTPKLGGADLSSGSQG